MKKRVEIGSNKSQTKLNFTEDKIKFTVDEDKIAYEIADTDNHKKESHNTPIKIEYSTQDTES